MPRIYQTQYEIAKLQNEKVAGKQTQKQKLCWLICEES